MALEHADLTADLTAPAWEGPVPEGARVLVVDDDEPIRRALVRILAEVGHECDTACDVADATRKLSQRSYDLMLCDVIMPDANGLTLLAVAHNEYPDMAVIMVTGVDDPRVAQPLARNGAYGFVSKPYSSSTILVNVASALQRRAQMLVARDRSEMVRRELDDHFATVSAAVRELQSSTAALHTAQEEAVDRLARAVKSRQASANAHLNQISEHTAKMAQLLHLGPEEVEIFRQASKLHDIGELALPDRILDHRGPLEPEDRALVIRHPEIGAEILRGSDSPLLRTASVMALTHHERWDGTGYPRGLAGTDIPMAGRIVAIADAFDALCHERPYKPSLPTAEAADVMRSARGSHFDPDLLDLFLDRVVGHEIQLDAT